MSRIAVVTGAGRGIGAATATWLADHGHKVVLTARTVSEIEAVASQIRARYGADRVLAIAADVSDEKQVRALFEQVRGKMGLVSILVNNAGALARAPFEGMDVSVFDRVMAVNVRGAFLCSQRLFEHVRLAGQGGCIVNISSLGGIRSTVKFEGLSAYVTSKHAVVGLTESLAVEGKPLGIRVNCVAPGAVDTKMLREAAPFLKTSTKPEDVAEVIGYLCDESKSKSLNGSVLEINSNE